MFTVLSMIASAAMIAIGVLAFVFPARFTEFTELKATTPMAMGELRGAVGGMYIGLGVVALLYPSEEVYFALAAGWLGVLVGKLAAAYLDKLDLKQTKVLQGVGVDAALVVLFFLGYSALA